MKNTSLHIRLLSGILMITGALTGIFTRKASEQIPHLLALYGGDTSWAFSAYFLIKIFYPRLKILPNALIAFVFSILIELSQLIHFSLLDQIRSTFIGGLALGFGFHWQDIPCYLAGVLLASVVDGLMISFFTKKRHFLKNTMK